MDKKEAIGTLIRDGYFNVCNLSGLQIISLASVYSKKYNESLVEFLNEINRDLWLARENQL